MTKLDELTDMLLRKLKRNIKKDDFATAAVNLHELFRSTGKPKYLEQAIGFYEAAARCGKPVQDLLMIAYQDAGLEDRQIPRVVTKPQSFYFNDGKSPVSIFIPDGLHYKIESGIPAELGFHYTNNGICSYSLGNYRVLVSGNSQDGFAQSKGETVVPNGHTFLVYLGMIAQNGLETKNIGVGAWQHGNVSRSR